MNILIDQDIISVHSIKISGDGSVLFGLRSNKLQNIMCPFSSNNCNITCTFCNCIIKQVKDPESYILPYDNPIKSDIFNKLEIYTCGKSISSLNYTNESEIEI